MMPDIAMCPNDECPSKATCYRNEASGTKPSPLRQSWMLFEYDPDMGMCFYYVASIEGHEKKKNHEKG